MAIQLSPSVVVQERDLTNVVPAVSTSVGAAIVDAAWGPVMDVTTIDSENRLVSRFGRPNATNAASWFTAANFLAYSNNLLVVRTDTDLQRNSVSALTGSVTALAVTAGGSGYTAATVTISAPEEGGTLATADVIVSGGVVTGFTITNPGSGYIAATATISGAGTLATADVIVSGGVVTGFTITNPGSGYTAATVTISAPEAAGGIQATADVIVSGGAVTGFTITNPGFGYTAATATISGDGTLATATVTITQGGVKINNETHYLTTYEAGQGVVGEFAAKFPGTLGNSLTVSMADAASFATWTYKDLFDSAPGTSSSVAAVGGSGDELHIVVVDSAGKWTGTVGTVLETYAFASKAGDARKEDGSTAYYKNVLNNNSAYVWWMDHPTVGTNWGQDAAGVTFASIGATAITRALSGGVDHFVSTNGQKMGAFELFNNDEEFDVNLIMCGKADATVASYVVQNVAEFRKDCVAFVSPQDASSGEVLAGNSSDLTEKILTFRNALPSSSYMVVDTGYKYQYDRYNDAYRWVPLNGDVAGLCARTDYTDDPWFSPAGLNRGQIKNVVKLAYSPRKTDRDNLYKSGVNPVVSFPGQGVVLYGDKTGLTKPSAFDRINVRRLFITLEKAIATAAKYQLFEFNDEFTRAQFRNIVEPFLRDVQGRRGLTDFRVICDDTNNTAEVIDTNRFVADIYIKPARSINYVQLNFIATRTGASFSEIAG